MHKARDSAHVDIVLASMPIAIQVVMFMHGHEHIVFHGSCERGVRVHSAIVVKLSNISLLEHLRPPEVDHLRISAYRPARRFPPSNTTCFAHAAAMLVLTSFLGRHGIPTSSVLAVG